MKLYIEVCNILSSCDSMHTEYDVTCIDCDVIQRVGVVSLIGFDDTDGVDVVLDIVGQMADKMFVLPYVLCHILGL